ncbi:MAG: hypothetical protein WA160_16995 [Pseudobdellovibrio sp.]
MKLILPVLFILLSLAGNAQEHTGYVQRLIEDDHGIKIVFSTKENPQDTTEIKTLYLKNTQQDFQENAKIVMDSQKLNIPLLIKKDFSKNLTIKQLGQ